MSNTTEKLASSIGEGVKMGVASEGVDLAYHHVTSILINRFGISKEKLEKPMNKELILLVSMAMLHTGSNLLDDVLPGMENVREGCELVIKGKSKDYTQMAMMTLLPSLLKAGQMMNPQNNMARIADDVSISKDLEAILHASEKERKAKLEAQETEANQVATSGPGAQTKA